MSAVATPAPTSATSVERVARGSAANLVGAVVSTLTNLGLIVALTHQLSRRDAGVFFAATSLFLLLETASGLGTSTAAVYFLPRLKHERDFEGVQTVLSLATRVVGVASVVAMEVLLFLPRRFGQAEGQNNLHHGVDLLWVLALLLPFATMSDIFQGPAAGSAPCARRC
jgi:O-antigen/teichoic acid export membrane protein